MTAKRQRLCSLVLAISIAATATPSALARPVEGFLGSDADARDASEPPVRIVRVTSDASFDWGDPQIGAGAVLAVGLVGAGGAFAIRKRRHTRPATLA